MERKQKDWSRYQMKIIDDVCKDCGACMATMKDKSGKEFMYCPNCMDIPKENSNEKNIL